LCPVSSNIKKQLAYSTNSEIIDRPDRLQSRHLAADWPAGSVVCASTFYFESIRKKNGPFYPIFAYPGSLNQNHMRAYFLLLFARYHFISFKLKIFRSIELRHYNQRTKMYFLKIISTPTANIPNRHLPHTTHYHCIAQQKNK
jgi:hypothetical protein